MPLALGDVMSRGKLDKLRQRGLKYSSLVSFYRGLRKEQLGKMFTEKTSFLKLLMDSGLQVSTGDGDKQDVKKVVTKILSQKILIGLMAVDKIPIKNVVSTILHMDSCFASDDLISKICQDDSQLVVKSTAKDKFVMMSQSLDVDAGKKKMNANSNTCLSTEKMRECLLRYFCKSRPELLRGVQLSAEYKDILKVYQFWSESKMIKDCEFISWLIDLAQTHCKDDFDTYKQNIYQILAKLIVEFVTTSSRNIAQIVGNFCFDKPSFIHSTTIKEIVLSCPHLLRIKDECHSEVLDQQVVTFVETYSSTKSFYKCSTKNLECLKGKRDASQEPDDSACDFKLPHDVKNRITNVLTLRSTLPQISQIYNVVHTKAVVQALVEKYGCFLSFLIEFGSVSKPAKLGGTVYGDHLKDCAVAFLISFAEGQEITLETLKRVASKTTTQGFFNDEFLRDALSRKSKSELSSGQAKMVNNNMSKIVGTNEISSYAPSENPVADLESPRVIHLLTRKPRFVEISNVFNTLPEEAVLTLARNSMSFFEWVIALCKRLMPYDAEGLESHLQDLVQVQVAKLHAAEHCQMTIHHVHGLLCGEQPLLLSPNFIGYCLEQPGSSFCIYQSWIYLRTGNEQQRRRDEVTSQESLNQPTEVINREAFINAVRMSKSLQQIISITNCISCGERDHVLGSGMCWYEFIENNSTRHDRTRLASLLVADVDRLLAGTVAKLPELWLQVCKGSSRFISVKIMEEILRQHSMRFALSRNGKHCCYVARVRSVEAGNVKCVDPQEDNFLEKILLYFPPKGSCDFATILQMANKEKILSHGQELDADFLECFFMAFPMLFYLHGNTAILTCMALDSKLEYIKRFQNDEGRRRGRKREKDESRHNRRKRKKSSFSPTRLDSPIYVNDSEEESPCKAQYAPSCCVESPDSNDNVEEAIENLLPDLVGDMTMSILKENGGRRSKTPLVKELVSSILGHEEAIIVVASMKYMSMFERKISSMVRMDSRFETVSDNQDQNVISEVMIAEDGVCHINDEASVKEESAQVREVTSTSRSPVVQLEHDDNVASRTNTDGIIKLTPPRPSDANEEDDQLIISTTDKNTNQKGASPKEISDPVANNTDDDCGDLVVDTDRKTSDAEDVKSKSSTSSEISPYVPSYGSLSSESCAYKYIHSGSASTKRDDKAVKDRVKMFHVFTHECLTLNAGSYATELLIADAYRRFRDERCCRSLLAFEAYMFDFIVNNASSYSLTGTDGGAGVSKITFAGVRNAIAEHAFHALRDLIPDIPPSCTAFLSSKHSSRATIDSITQYVVDRFSKQLEMFSKNELNYAVRCLTLVGTIRNLKEFCFAPNAEPVIYLRAQTAHKEDSTHFKPPNSEIAEKIKPIVQSERLRNAMLLMGSIIKKSTPATFQRIRELWVTEAPKTIANVFGSGISFTIVIRKYSFLFPPAVGGEFSVNADALEIIRRGTERPLGEKS